MHIVFIIQDYREANFPLQPWLTFKQVGTWLRRKGYVVSVISDVESNECDMNCYAVASLRRPGGDAIQRILQQLSPDWVVTTITPLNLVTSDWFGCVSAHWLAYSSYAFYKPAEIMAARHWLAFGDWFPYARHMLVPKILWRRKLSSRFTAVISQSQRTLSRLCQSKTATVQGYMIPAGIDREIWHCDVVSADEKSEGAAAAPLLYVGSARAIRGFDLLLQAMTLAVRAGVRLRVLARAADDESQRTLQTLIDNYGLSQSVELEGGWIAPRQLAEQVQAASAVVLPFVLVPSELPVSVLEALAMGTPVIVSDINGLPEAAGEAGLVVPAGDAKALANCLIEFWQTPNLRQRLEKKAFQRAHELSDWFDVAAQWEAVFDVSRHG